MPRRLRKRNRAPGCTGDLSRRLAQGVSLIGDGMISDLDIWRAANLLIHKHGANAELEAAKRADLMLDRGDDERRLVWARIRRAIAALRAPPSGRPH